MKPPPTKNCKRCGAPAELMIDDSHFSDIITCSKYCGEYVSTIIKDESVDLIDVWNKEQSKPIRINERGNFY